MKKDTITCPKCGKDAQCSGQVLCWCDKDFCMGQRCGADNLYKEYHCQHCGERGEPEETTAYYNRHAPKD